MEPDFAQNAAFDDELAAHYDALLGENIYNALAREAFLELVGRYVSPASTLLDFGCGTGLDAVQYAKKGFRVLAFDNSPGMVAQLRSRPQADFDAGKITAWSESYPSFLSKLPREPRASAMTANFAVLNSIGQLRPLFDTLAGYLAPPGWVIVSILNPLHWLKLATPGWWVRATWEGNGSPIYTAKPYTTYLHFVKDLLRAAPRFHLVGRANAGRFVRYDEWASGKSTWWRVEPQASIAERILWRMAVRRVLGHFVFLVLRRDL